MEGAGGMGWPRGAGPYNEGGSAMTPREKFRLAHGIIRRLVDIGICKSLEGQGFVAESESNGVQYTVHMDVLTLTHINITEDVVASASRLASYL